MTAYVRVPVGKPRSPGWYAARDGGIGASEAAIALGWEPFGKHPLDLWHDKHHPRERDDRDTPEMRSGRYVEDAVARMWADEHGQRLITPPALIRSKQWPWMLASLDRAVSPNPRSRTITAPLEVKCVWHGWDDWQDAPPDHVIAQVIHQLTVLDQDRGHIAALIGGKVKSYDVEVTREQRVEWADTIGAWWDKHIVHGERPSLDTPPADRSVIARAVPRPTWRTLDKTGDKDARLLIRRRAEIAADAATAARLRDVLTDELARLLADHERLVIDGAEVATYKPDSNGRRTLRVYPQRLPQETQ